MKAFNVKVLQVPEYVRGFRVPRIIVWHFYRTNQIGVEHSVQLVMTSLFLGPHVTLVCSSQIGSPLQTKDKHQQSPMFLQKYGWGVLKEQEQESDSQTAASLKPTLAWVTAYRPGNLEHTAGNSSQAGELRCLSQSQTLCSSAPLREVFAAWLPFREGLSASKAGQTSWSCSKLFVFCLRSFLEDGMF